MEWKGQFWGGNSKKKVRGGNGSGDWVDGEILRVVL